MHEVAYHIVRKQDRLALFAVLFSLVLGLIAAFLTPLLSLAIILGLVIALVMFVMPYVALLLFLMLLYLRPADYFPVLQPFMLTKLAAIVCLVSWFITNQIVERRPFLSTRESRWLFAFLAAIFLSFVSSEDIPFSFSLFFEKFFKIIVLYILITNLSDSRNKVVILIWVLIGLALWNGGLSIQNYFSGTRVVGSLGRTSLVGIMGDPNDLALSLVIVIPFMIGFIINTRSLALKLFLVLGIAELSYAILLTMSRGGLMGWMAVMVSLFLYGKSRSIQLGLAGMGVLLMLGVVTNSIGLRGDDEGAEESGESRIWLWTAGVAMAKQSPIWGQGFGNYPRKIVNYSDRAVANKTAHSIWFLVLGELGLYGLASFVAFILFALCKSLAILQYTEQIRAPSAFRGLMRTAYASLIGFLVCGTFLSQSYEWFLYIIVAIIVVIYENTDPEVKVRAVLKPAYLKVCV
jgi:probable O-glycosylation ligase (exosortase A-associated)